MKENFKEIIIEGQKYLLNELTEVEEGSRWSMGGLFCMRISEEVKFKLRVLGFDADKYKGIIIFPKTNFNESLPDNIRKFALYHEAGHFEEGGLPLTKTEYLKNFLKCEKIADKYAANRLGKYFALEALENFKKLNIKNLKKIYKKSWLLRNLSILVFNLEMSARIKNIKKI